MHHVESRESLFCLAVASSTLAAQSQEPLPRFRAGAPLMQVDAYISQDGVPVTDLGLAELEVLEDDRPQEVANIKLIQPRSTTVSAPVPPAPAGALFVLFFDTLHVSPESAARAHEQMSKLLNAVMGPQDRVGIMTPEISAQNITLTRPAGGVDGVLRDMSLVAQPGGRRDSSDARERGLEMCYPDATMAGVAKELIARRREQMTLRALDDLMTFLEGRRDERKFVIVISSGWTLFRRNEQLAAPAAATRAVATRGIDAMRTRTEDACGYRRCRRDAKTGPTREPRQRQRLSRRPGRIRNGTDAHRIGRRC